MLKACAKEVGSIQIQNLGTIGGNICNASPAADSIPCLLALDAKLELSSANNQRIIPIDEFILGSRKTKLEQGEILTSIIIPKEKENGSSSFRKIGARKYLVISISMVACRILISNNIIEDISISVGSCSEVAKRIFSIERQLIKKDINEDVFNKQRCRFRNCYSCLLCVDEHWYGHSFSLFQRECPVVETLDNLYEIFGQ